MNKTVEEISKESQIKELFKDLCEAPTGCVKRDFTIRTLKETHTDLFIRTVAEHLVSLNYRKQSEGEWQIVRKVHNILGDLDTELYVECPICHRTFWVPDGYGKKEIFEYASEHYPYCNCGAKMKGV